MLGAAPLATLPLATGPLWSSGATVGKNASDSLSLDLGEVMAIFSSLSRSDGLSVLAQDETESIAATLSRSDSLGLVLGDAMAIFGSLFRADDLSVELGEYGEPRNLVDVADTLGLTLTEAFDLLVALQRVDDLLVALTEQVIEIDTTFVALFASDTLEIGLDEFIEILSSLDRSDELSLDQFTDEIKTVKKYLKPHSALVSLNEAGLSLKIKSAGRGQVGVGAGSAKVNPKVEK